MLKQNWLRVDFQCLLQISIFDFNFHLIQQKNLLPIMPLFNLKSFLCSTSYFSLFARPAGSYIAYNRIGNTLYLSGHLPWKLDHYYEPGTHNLHHSKIY